MSLAPHIKSYNFILAPVEHFLERWFPNPGPVAFVVSKSFHKNQPNQNQNQPQTNIQTKTNPPTKTQNHNQTKKVMRAPNILHQRFLLKAPHLFLKPNSVGYLPQSLSMPPRRRERGEGTDGSSCHASSGDLEGGPSWYSASHCLRAWAAETTRSPFIKGAQNTDVQFFHFQIVRVPSGDAHRASTCSSLSLSVCLSVCLPPPSRPQSTGLLCRPKSSKTVRAQHLCIPFS